MTLALTHAWASIMQIINIPYQSIESFYPLPAVAVMADGHNAIELIGTLLMSVSNILDHRRRLCRHVCSPRRST